MAIPKSATLYGAALVLSSAFSAAVATPGGQPLGVTLDSSALQKISVFCGAGGCMPVTRVKRCAPDTVNQGLPAQRAIIVRHTCNFL